MVSKQEWKRRAKEKDLQVDFWFAHAQRMVAQARRLRAERDQARNIAVRLEQELAKAKVHELGPQ